MKSILRSDIGMDFILASKDSDDINLTSSIETQKVCEIGLSFISTKQIGKIRFSENKALYVCEPNYNSVKKITKRMKKVMKETKENESSASDKNDVIK